MVEPAARRSVVLNWVEHELLSERCGSRLMDVSRSVVRYQNIPRDDDALRKRMRALAERYPRYGYPTLHAMLRHEGLVKNRRVIVKSGVCLIDLGSDLIEFCYLDSIIESDSDYDLRQVIEAA